MSEELKLNQILKIASVASVLDASYRIREAARRKAARAAEIPIMKNWRSNVLQHIPPQMLLGNRSNHRSAL